MLSIYCWATQKPNNWDCNLWTRNGYV
jgi:hypothetical protein